MNLLQRLLCVIALAAGAAPVWAAPADKPTPPAKPELTVEHVPGQKALRVKVRNAPQDLRSWSLTLTPMWQETDLARTTGSKLDPAGVVLKLPDLASGQYRLVIRLDDGFAPITLGRTLIVVGSFGEGGECTLKPDLKALGLPKTAKAVNAEKEQQLQSVEPGTFVLPIKKHDVAFVLVE